MPPSNTVHLHRFFKAPPDRVCRALLEPVRTGTNLTITQERLPAAVPVEECYTGWQQSLNMLASPVEPAIP